MIALEKSGWIEEDAFLDLLRSLQPPHESACVTKEELKAYICEAKRKLGIYRR